MWHLKTLDSHRILLFQEKQTSPEPFSPASQKKQGNADDLAKGKDAVVEVMKKYKAPGCFPSVPGGIPVPIELQHHDNWSSKDKDLSGLSGCQAEWSGKSEELAFEIFLMSISHRTYRMLNMDGARLFSIAFGPLAIIWFKHVWAKNICLITLCGFSLQVPVVPCGPHSFLGHPTASVGRMWEFRTVRWYGDLDTYDTCGYTGPGSAQIYSLVLPLGRQTWLAGKSPMIGDH